MVIFIFGLLHNTAPQQQPKNILNNVEHVRTLLEGLNKSARKVVPMSNQGTLVSVALSAWNTNIERAEKLFFNLSKEQLNAEVAPGKNRLIYLWGHFTAVHDAMLPLLDFGPRLYPQFDNLFITSPDKAATNLPAIEELKKSWTEVTAKLSEGFGKLNTDDWLARHTAVSAEDFAKNPLRNRFAILLSRTNHLSYHLGQAVLTPK